MPGIDCSASDLSISVLSSVKSDCDQPGTITAEASGGEGAYVYSIEEEEFQSSGIFDNLFAGNYTIKVKDELGCTASIDFLLESEPTGILLTLTGGESECSNDTGSITAEASGGVGSLIFSFDGGTFSTVNEYANVSAGTHTITVRDEENCQVSKSIRITTTTSLLNDIMPIMMNDCAIFGCHNGSQSPRLQTTSEVIQNATRIKSETQSGSMPRDRTLSQTEIDFIACWVDDGARDN